MTRLRALVPLMLLLAACGDGGTISAPAATAPAAAAPEATSGGATAPPETTAPGRTAPLTTVTTHPATTSSTTPVTATTVATPAASTATLPLDETELTLELVASGLGQPVFVDAPAGDPRIFIVDQPGRIWIVDGDLRPFLDIRDLVQFGGERGLLGFAFHPGYADNGRFFVHYSTLTGAGRIAEYRTSADSDVADPASAQVLLEIPQPAGNHNGGMLAFGPDGYLYVGLGDGGGSDDQFRQGQRPDTLLATLLRLDVDGAEPYAIPPDNPFVAGGGAAEVWAYGLRNPWRFSFDGDSLYIGDVGQREWEEINVVATDAGGLNFGWPIMEGRNCFRPASGCEAQGLVLPVLEYGHGPECSVTGGYVYRGSAVPQLNGHYFYGDFCSGRIWSFLWDGSTAVDHRDWTDQLGRVTSLTSFGTDASGEVYVTAANGSVYKIVPARG